MGRSRWIASSLLLLTVLGVGAGLAGWKRAEFEKDAEANAHPQEPMEAVTAGVAGEQPWQRTTTSIGTVVALRSVTLKNELPGTVKEVTLTPGAIVEPDTLLVALDVSVEEAELKAETAQVALAESTLGRMQRALESHGASALDVDRAKAERDVAQAQVERTQAVIARKTIRAPFKARVGLSDVHRGQFLNEGTVLTTLQGVDDSVYVDFEVAQLVATGLSAGTPVAVYAAGQSTPMSAKVVALDARVDAATRNTTVRAQIDGAKALPAPGASVRVHVPVGPEHPVVVVPVSALRKSPSGDHVFVLEPDQQGRDRARLRPVESGAMLGDTIVIEQGLKSGERIAVSGSFKLHEGELVGIVPADAPDAHAAGAAH